MQWVTTFIRTFQRGMVDDEGDAYAFPSQLAKKPYLPAFLFLSLGLWLGIYITYGLARFVSDTQCAILFIACLCFTLLVLLAYLKEMQYRLVVAVIGIGLGGMCGFAQGAVMHEISSIVSESGAHEYLFEVVEDVQIGEFGNSCVVEGAIEGGRRVRIRAYLSDRSLEVNFGDIFKTTTSLKSVADITHAYYWEHGISATASIRAVDLIQRGDAKGMILAFRKEALVLFEGYQGAGSAFLRAMLFGDRTELNAEEEFYSQIKVVGLAHVVAVSGAHLVIVTSLFGTVLSALRLPRKAVVIVQGVFVLMYLVCAGIPLSAVRAACMTLISMFSVFAKRASSGISALGICLCCLLVLSPTSATSVTLMLSAGATLGILLFSGLFRQWVEFIFKRGSAMNESLSMTISSGVFTTFVCAALFSQVSLISPVANLLFLPFFSFLCGGGLAFVLIALLFPAFGQPLLDLLVMCAQAVSGAVEQMARIPFAAIPASMDITWALIAAILAGCVLWKVWPRPTLKNAIALSCAMVCLIVVVGLPAVMNRDLEVIMLDVGQGDAFVIRSGSSTVLIDTGNQTSALLSALARHGIYYLDAVLVSHADSDHCGSLSALQGVIGVGSVLISDETLSCRCRPCSSLRESAAYLVGADRVVPLKVGDRVKIGILNFEVIWPDKFEDEGGNSDSLSGILHADLDDDGKDEWKLLFCGDLETEQLETLISQNKIGDLDVLKVGHHGSRAALNQGIITTLKPEIALISVGANNRYGHPAAQTMDLLEEISCATFQTSEQGDVVCKLYQDRLEVVTLR